MKETDVFRPSFPVGSTGASRTVVVGVTTGTGDGDFRFRCVSFLVSRSRWAGGGGGGRGGDGDGGGASTLGVPLPFWIRSTERMEENDDDEVERWGGGLLSAVVNPTRDERRLRESLVRLLFRCGSAFWMHSFVSFVVDGPFPFVSCSRWLSSAFERLSSRFRSIARGVFGGGRTGSAVGTLHRG